MKVAHVLKVKSLANLGVVLAFLVLGASCGDPDDDGEQSSSVSAMLKSTKLSSTGLRLSTGVTLTNVTGLADSVGLALSANNVCGFNVWGANGQTSRAGTEGRSYEQYDLKTPVSWTSKGAGMQGECDSGQVMQIESYFVYMDLHMTVNSSSKKIRIYMGEESPAKAGDLMIEVSGVWNWLDTASGELVPVSSTRPNTPKRFTLPKEIPWFDNNGTEKIIMMEYRINPDKNDYTVTKNTSRIDIDIDFSAANISVSDTSSDAKVLETVSLPFLTSSLLTASLAITEGGEE